MKGNKKMEMKIYQSKNYKGYFIVDNNTVHYIDFSPNKDFDFSLDKDFDFLIDEDELNWDLDYYQKMNIADFMKLEGLIYYSIDEYNEIIKQHNPSADFFHPKK